MSKMYKGWELMRDIAEGKIEEGSEFNIYEDKEMYFDRPAIYANGVLRHNGILVTEFVSLEKMMKLDFELIEEKQDIDIQELEERGQFCNLAGLTENEEILWEMIQCNANTINETVKALKQLDRKINKE